MSYGYSAWVFQANDLVAVFGVVDEPLCSRMVVHLGW